MGGGGSVVVSTTDLVVTHLGARLQALVDPYFSSGAV